jgi:hypothetical protein
MKRFRPVIDPEKPSFGYEWTGVLFADVILNPLFYPEKYTLKRLSAKTLYGIIPP